MKAIRIIATAAAVAVLASSCSMFSKSAKTPADGTSTTSETAAAVDNTAAKSAGQSAGQALRTLFTAYTSNNNKLDLSNATNLLTIAALSSSISDLKGADKTYKKGFASGLILGSTNLVTAQTSNTVVDQLSTIATNVANSDAAQKVGTTATNAATTAASVASSASTIADSVSSILGLFGKK